MSPRPRGKSFWTDERKAEFAAMYKSGTQLKIIADHFGISLSSAKNQRRSQNLRTRRKTKGRGLTKEINLRMTEVLWRDARRRALERGVSLNEYIRYCIRVNVGKAEDA